MGRFNGKPAAIMALYQLPGSNALDAAKGVKKRMEELKKRFPADIDYDSRAGHHPGRHRRHARNQFTFLDALGLVILVVFVFLQGWRATLIPLLAVPVSLIGTFASFPLLGFSINTLVALRPGAGRRPGGGRRHRRGRGVEHHIDEGLSPKAAAFKAMEEVSGPVVAIALILAAVFVPTVFIPGITGRLYQQFAVTIAISVLISAFNALTLSPALSALLLRPRKSAAGRCGRFFTLVQPRLWPRHPRLRRFLRASSFAKRPSA